MCYVYTGGVRRCTWERGWALVPTIHGSRIIYKNMDKLKGGKEMDKGEEEEDLKEVVLVNVGGDELYKGVQASASLL